MSDQKINDLRGYLYKNKNKTRPDQPDFIGKTTINGEVWSVASWENKDKKTGEIYLKSSYSVPKPRTENSTVGTENGGSNKTNGSYKGSTTGATAGVTTGENHQPLSTPKESSFVTSPDSFRPTPEEAGESGNALDDIEKLFGAGTSGSENKSPFD